MNNRNKVLTIVTILIAGLFSSCLKNSFEKIPCRDFEFSGELKWYAGDKGDSLVFKNEKDEEIKFAVIEKFLFHQTHYVSNSGCNGCTDLWGMLLANETDSISFYSQSLYIADNVPSVYDLFYIKVNEQLTSFMPDDRVRLNTYTIDELEFGPVIRFQYNHTLENQFKTIYIAPEIGIIKMVGVNGDNWINTKLEEKLNIRLDSFDLTETSCD